MEFNSKKENGITMLSLMITVFMLAIVSATVIYYSRSLAKIAKLENVKSNMLLIQAQAKIISEKISYGENIEPIGSIAENGYYLLNANDLKAMGLDLELDSSEKYYVMYPLNGYSSEVKYEPGITYKGRVYKLLSEIETAEKDGTL